MCLGMPGQIVEVKSRTVAIADFWGIRKPVRLDQLTEQAAAGDYIIEHSGFAVRVIPIEDVPETIALYETVLAESGEPCPVELFEPAIA
jgi:hydrogenase expression/formation protein HypC